MFSMFFKRHSSYDLFSFPSLLNAMLHAMLLECVFFSFFLYVMSVNLTYFIKSFLSSFSFLLLSLWAYALTSILQNFENKSRKAGHSSREGQNELGEKL